MSVDLSPEALSKWEISEFHEYFENYVPEVNLDFNSIETLLKIADFYLQESNFIDDHNTKKLAQFIVTVYGKWALEFEFHATHFVYSDIQDLKGKFIHFNLYFPIPIKRKELKPIIESLLPNDEQERLQCLESVSNRIIELIGMYDNYNSTAYPEKKVIFELCKNILEINNQYVKELMKKYDNEQPRKVSKDNLPKWKANYAVLKEPFFRMLIKIEFLDSSTKLTQFEEVFSGILVSEFSGNKINIVGDKAPYIMTILNFLYNNGIIEIKKGSSNVKANLVKDCFTCNNRRIATIERSIKNYEQNVHLTFMKDVLSPFFEGYINHISVRHYVDGSEL